MLFKNAPDASDVAANDHQHLVEKSPPELPDIEFEQQCGSLTTPNLLTDSYLLLGTTGLTGGIILNSLAEPWLYLGTTNDVQDKIQMMFEAGDLSSESNPPNVKRTFGQILRGEKSIEITKNLFCFNRKLALLEIPSTPEYINDYWEYSIDYKGTKYHSKKNNISFGVPTLKFGKLVNSNENSITNQCQLQQFDYKFEFQREDPSMQNLRTRAQTLIISLKINVIQILEPNSKLWPLLLHSTFGDTDTNVALHVQGQVPTPMIFPSLSKVNTLVSALGSTTFEQKKSHVSRDFVDYDLNFKMAEEFTTNSSEHGIKKKVVVITSFNNFALSSTSPYFHTKLKLEQDLATRIPELDELVILRPGPLIGSHTPEFIPGDPPKSTNGLLKPLSTVCYYKKACYDHKRHFLQSVTQVGLKTKMTEVFARLIYRSSCSWMFGYSVPVAKVAVVAAIRTIQKIQNDPESGGIRVQLIKSDELDVMV